MLSTLYSFTVDGDNEEALVYLRDDRTGQRDKVIEGQELQSLLPQILALQSALAVAMRRRHTKA